MPSVSRSCPITGSVPSTVTTSPSAPAMQSLEQRGFDQPGDHRQREDEEREELPRPELQRERRQRPGGADEEHAAEQPAEERSPHAEPDARPGSPLRAIGWPSKVVAIADGVPGMPSSTAVTRPPAEPPT